MTNTDTAAQRVARYRKEYADRSWTLQDGKEARAAAVAACKANALEALAEDDPASASAWIALAQLDSYTYRSF